MYEELIKELREYGDIWRDQLLYEAADAIEKLVLELGKTSNSNGKTSWIPATERLPSEDGFTLIFTAHGHAGVCYFTNDWWGGYDKDGITHWMPLPKPPKEET